MKKHTERYKLSLKILMVTSILVPFINIIFFKFNFSSFSTGLSIAFSMAVTVFYNLKFFGTKEVKMTGFFITAILMPFFIIGSIVYAHLNSIAMDIMNTYPIYTMFPMFAIAYGTMKVTFKVLENNANETITKVLNLKPDERETILNFTNNIFYEKFGNFKINIGEKTIEGSTISVDKLFDREYVEKVSNMAETEINKLTVDEFLLYEMSEI